MHLDRNPTDPYLLNTKDGIKKFKPIQSLLTLTDHFGSNHGGLKVVKEFHKEIDEYFKDKIYEGGGEFCRLNSKSHTNLEKRLEAIQAPRGSLVFWDNRLPHATFHKLGGFDTREVIFIGFMPEIDLNKKYCENQLKNIKKNIYPPAYLKDPKIMQIKIGMIRNLLLYKGNCYILIIKRDIVNKK